MKAFLLAAGYGTRLRPLTDTVPKCLVPVCGKPLLAHWFELLEYHGVTDVYVNTHYLAEKVRDFISLHNNKNCEITAHEMYEEKLLGSGGTVKSGRNYVGDDDFLICYADNLTNMDLSALIKKHKESKPVLTMALFRTNKPEMCGIATLSGEIIADFTEKPKNPASNLANAGIYVASKELFDYLPDKEVIDFGYDVLPALCGKMIGVEQDSYLIDIGTPDNYKSAQEDWKKYDNYKNSPESKLCRRRN